MTTDVETSLEVQLLEALDFAASCGHEGHEDPSQQWRHGGDAEFIATYSAPCGYRVVRPVCAPWAAAIPQAPSWSCRDGCGGWHRSEDVVWDIRPLNAPS